MTNKTRLTQKGQATIPKHIREYLGLKTSNFIEFKIKDGQVIIKPADSLEKNFGKIKPKKRPEDFKKIRDFVENEIAKEAGEEI